MKKFVIVLLLAGVAGYLAWRYQLLEPFYTDKPVAADNATTTQVEKKPTVEQAEAAAAVLQQARSAARDGDMTTARRLYVQIIGQYPNTWAGRESSLEMGDYYLKQGLRDKALAAFEAGLPNVEGEKFQQLKGLIDRLRQELGRGAQEASGDLPTEDTVHVVQRGETLSSIAQKYAVTVEQIKLANHRTDDLIRVGEPLKITFQLPEIRVNKSTHTLQLFFKGTLIKAYPVGIGREDRTPAGTFKITEKLKHPPWYRDGKERIEYGDPRNILGTRWMTIVGKEGYKQGLGIHGTSDPSSVPGNTSAGCVRLKNPDVEELFEWVPRGTQVTIIEG